MKRIVTAILLISLVITLILFIPFGSLSANPGNLVQNGDFSDGSNHWELSNSSIIGGEALVGPGNGAYVYQPGINASNKNIVYSVDVTPTTYGSGGSFEVALELYKGVVSLGWKSYNYSSLTTGKLSHISFKYKIEEFNLSFTM